MARIACAVCGVEPREGVSLFRMNAKGQPGVWACEKHADEAQIDPEVKEITDILEGKKGQ